MSIQEFEQIKGSMRVGMSQRESSMTQDLEDNLMEIQSRNLVFNRKNKEIEELEKLSIETFKERFEQIFGAESKRIELQITSKNHHVEQDMFE